MIKFDKTHTVRAKSAHAPFIHNYYRKKDGLVGYSENKVTNAAYASQYVLYYIKFNVMQKETLFSI